MERSFFQKLCLVLYWRVYNLITAVSFAAAKLYAYFFVQKKERKYWLMNAKRVIESRKDKKEEVREFETILERRKDLLQNHTEKQLRRDFLKCRRKYGYVAEQYFSMNLWNKSERYRNQAVSRWKQFHIDCSLNSVKDKHKADNKAEFVKTFKEFLGRKVLNMKECNREEFIDLLNNEKIVIKPTDNCGGQGIQVLSTNDFSPNDKIKLYEQYQGTNTLVEEYIKQTGLLHDLCPDTVNTIRIATLYNGKEVFIPFAFLRTGRMNGLSVDNLHAGGIEWPIDHQKGIVSNKGFDNKGIEYLCHPDTSIQIVGIKLPRWEEAIEKVKKAATMLPELQFLGFDVVISNGGIYLIECNCSSGTGRLYSDSYDLWGFMRDYMDRTLGEDRPMRYFES